MEIVSVKAQSVKVFEIDGTGVVVECRCREQDGYSTAQRSRRKNPQEETIQYHSDKTPIVILLKIKNKHI